MKVMGQKSWAAGAPMELLELPTPQPKSNEVRVAVRAIGVNPVDWKMRTRGPLRIAARLVGPPPPVVVGVDFAGVVDAVGTAVTTVKVGDAVVGGTDFSRKQHGSYADTVLVRAEQLCVLPAGFDLDVAAALPVAAVTAWMALTELSHIKAGTRVLVLGASGAVGQCCVQLARHTLGATVVGVCSARNAALVTSLGANTVLDYGVTGVLDRARELGPFDAVVDSAGGYSAAACRGMLAKGGRHIMVAGSAPLDLAQVLVPPFTSKSILGVATQARLQHVVNAVAAGQLKMAIARVMPLTSAEEAHRISQEGRLTGKLVLHP